MLHSLHQLTLSDWRLMQGSSRTLCLSEFITRKQLPAAAGKSEKMVQSINAAAPFPPETPSLRWLPSRDKVPIVPLRSFFLQHQPCKNFLMPTLANLNLN